MKSGVTARPWVFVIAQIDFLKAGNQSILNTVEGYVDGGFDVIMLSGRPQDDPAYYALEELPEYLREHLDVRFFSPALRAFFRAMQHIQHILRFRKGNNGNLKERPDTFDSGSGSDGFGVGTLRDCAVSALSTVSFVMGGFMPAARIIRRYRPEVLYGYEIYGASLAWFVKKIARGSVLVTRFQGTILYPHIMEHGKSVWRFPPHAIGLAVTHPDLLVMANDGTRGDEVCRTVGCDMKRVRFWPNGVSDEVFRIPGFDDDAWRKANGIAEDAFILLVTSRLVGWKRVDRALTLLADLKVQAAGVNWQLIIIGDGDQRGKLASEAERLGIQDRVRFLGHLPHSEVNNYLNGCDCVLSLNDYSNLGNPVFEALRVGKVTVTIDDGSTGPVLRANENSLMAALDGFPSALTKALVQFRGDRKWRTALESAARRDGQTMALSWSERMQLEVDEVAGLVKARHSLST